MKTFKPSFLIVISYFLPQAIIAQSVSLTITNPQTTYEVGQSILFSISTKATNLSAITLVVLGNPYSVRVIPAPYVTTVTASVDLIGAHSFQASAVLDSGQVIFSNVAPVDVEPAAEPSSISILPLTLSFTFLGQQRTLQVLGKVSGRTAVLSTISPLSITSTDSSVAAVGLDKTITAFGGGKATIHAAYGSFTASIPVTVTSTITGDLDGNRVVDQDDLNLLMVYMNTASTIKSDGRDLNHDGRIDNKDALMLASSCAGGCVVPQVFDAIDINLDGVVNCVDLQTVSASLGFSRGSPSYDPHTDVDGNGVINILDLALVSRALPPGTSCPQP